MTGATNQLSLNITPRHAYAPENFVVHAGVRECLTQCLALREHDAFSIGFIVGAKRSGKTHLSIRLADELGRRGVYPRIIEGSDFKGVLEGVGFECGKEDVIIVDDAQFYLESLHPGESGPFVAFVELLRVARAGLVLLSDRDIDAFAFDQHVESRIRPGNGFQITDPEEGDMAALIEAVARQHGMKLTERKIGFIERRVRRTVASVEDYFQRLVHLSQVLGRPIKFPLMSGAV